MTKLNKNEMYLELAKIPSTIPTFDLSGNFVELELTPFIKHQRNCFLGQSSGLVYYTNVVDLEETRQIFLRNRAMFLPLLYNKI